MGLSNVNPQGWADNTPYGTLSSRETKKFDVDAYESAAVRQQSLDRNDHFNNKNGILNTAMESRMREVRDTLKRYSYQRPGRRRAAKL